MDIGDNMRPLWPKQYGCIWPSHHDPPAKNGQAVIFFFDRIVRGFISEISILGTVLGTSVHYQAINQFCHIAIYGIGSIFDPGDGNHRRARHACEISQLGNKIFRLSRDRATFSGHQL